MDRRTFLFSLLGMGAGLMTTRVHLGRLDDITGGTDQFGLYVSGPDGTVILDGTSDMFRIAATFTLQTPAVGAGPDSEQVSLVLNLGMTYAPAFQAFLVSSGQVLPIPHFEVGGTQLVDFSWKAQVTLTGTDQTTALARTHNHVTGGGMGTYNYRFYVYEQVAL